MNLVRLTKTAFTVFWFMAGPAPATLVVGFNLEVDSQMKTKKTSQNVHVLNGYIAALEYELRHHTEALLKVTQGSAPKNEKSLMMGIHGDNIQRLQNLIADWKAQREKSIELRK